MARGVAALATLAISIGSPAIALGSPAIALGSPTLERHARFFESAGPPRACALLLHGLNTDPQAMDTLARELADDGVLVLRAVLAGHEGSPGAFEEASRERWLSDAELAWRAIHARATELGLPCLAAGFSLGGLLLVDLANGDHSIRPDGFILFAPATRLRPGTALIRPLAALGIAIASAAPPAYRSASVVSANAYRALFASADAIARCPIPIGVPSLVLADGEDPLVDAQALAAAATGLRECRFVYLDCDGPAKGGRHHLMLDPATVGDASWGILRAEIRSFVDRVISGNDAR